jgi:SAM-dependent methyltransferase
MRLNLASGPHPAPAPWINLDLLPQPGLQLRADVGRLPFPDQSADRIYAGHLLEHIPLTQLNRVLAEWHRVLRGGGELMIVGPDIDRAVRQRQPQWLLESIIAHGEGAGGHAWTCSEGHLLHALRRYGWWPATPVDVATVRLPDWPNPAPEAAWQVAILCG